MKATAYITILLSLLTLWTPVEASRSRSAARLLGSIQVGPVRSKRGKIFNPELKRVDADAQINLTTGSQKPSNSGNGSATSASSNLESPQSNSNGAGTGLANNGATGNTGNNSTQNSKKPEGQDGPARNKPDEKKGTKQGSGSAGISYGLWWPVCVFVDGPDANSQIQEMVSMAAACGVNLEPKIMRVSGFSADDEKEINQKQRTGCNIVSSGHAPKGSSLVITNRSSTVADKMCGIFKDRKSPLPDDKKPPSTDVAGCNEVAKGGGSEDDIKKWERDAKADSKGDGWGGSASGSVAVGIVDSEGYTDGKVYSHETQGHGQFGWGNGKGAGNGIRNPRDPEDKGEEGSLGAYTGVGCSRMRETAIVDAKQKHKYYPDKTIYYNTSAPTYALGTEVFPTFKGLVQTAADALNSKNLNNAATILDAAGLPLAAGAARIGAALGNALSNHKKKGSSATSDAQGKRGGGNPRGDAGTAGTNRGDGSDGDPLANQVSGGSSGGPGDPNSTIVANREKSALADKSGSNGSNSGNSGGSSLDASYLEGFNPTGIDSTGSSTGSTSGVENRELASTSVSKTGEGESNADSDDLKSRKVQKPKKQERPIRKWDASQDQSGKQQR